MSAAVLRGALLMLALHPCIHAFLTFTEPIAKLPPGNYCKTSDGNLLCCKSRDDKCSIKVNNTRCYCDYFCLKSNGKDCCPDFRDVCLDNIPRTSNPIKAPKDSDKSHNYCNQTIIGKKSLCCEGRDDSCRIHHEDGECFCDNFCEHKLDCCPDYENTCRKSHPKPPCSPRHSNLDKDKNCISTSVPDWPIVNGTILGSCVKIGGTNHCCKDRDDNCRIPVTDYTYCYCDNFCTNPKTNDCCFDYKKVCEGETTDEKEGGPDIIVTEPSTDRPRYSSPTLPPYSTKTRFGSCKKYGCCRNRNDNCRDTYGITFCYCDQFCTEKVSNDCCPDFDESLCKNDKPTTASETPSTSTSTTTESRTTTTTVTTTESTTDTTVSSTTPYTPTSTKSPKSCYYEGQYYQRGQCEHTNCNICSCKETLAKENEVQMICEQTPCIVDVALKESVNSNLNLIWHASNYSFYWGRSLQDGVQYRLGTLEPGKVICGIKSSETDLNKMYPSCFDARIHWPDLVSDVQDQGWCSSSWALSTVQTAQDRLAIWSKGAKQFKLSTQQLLDCNLEEQRACHGGHIDRAWLYIDDSGLLEERCYSYTSGNTSEIDECLMFDKMSDDCQPITLPLIEEQHSSPIHLLPTEQAIMNEIMTYGPVQATMGVHRDFFMYHSGVYQPSPEVLDRVEGYHSVRLLGWGVDIDNDRHAVKYWLAANTWGIHWGEKGYFRIRRGHNDCEIESYVIATKPFHNGSSDNLQVDDSEDSDKYERYT